MNVPLIRVANVSKSFRAGSGLVAALSNASLKIEDGEFVALVGPSGSGKTTLLNLIGCLDRPTSGYIMFREKKVTSLSQTELSDERLRHIGFIFQDYNLIPTLSILENVEYVLWLQGVGSAERRRRATEELVRVGLKAQIQRRPNALSRGQQQRVAVARAIVHRPRVVLGDELTANLDHKTGEELMDFLKELNQKEKITFVYATHDPVMIRRAERVVQLLDGKIIKDEHNQI